MIWTRNILIWIQTDYHCVTKSSDRFFRLLQNLDFKYCQMSFGMGIDSSTLCFLNEVFFQSRKVEKHSFQLKDFYSWLSRNDKSSPSTYIAFFWSVQQAKPLQEYKARNIFTNSLWIVLLWDLQCESRIVAKFFLWSLSDLSILLFDQESNALLFVNELHN